MRPSKTTRNQDWKLKLEHNWRNYGGFIEKQKTHIMLKQIRSSLHSGSKKSGFIEFWKIPGH